MNLLMKDMSLMRTVPTVLANKKNITFERIHLDSVAIVDTTYIQ